MTSPSSQTLLVTGASGYIAGHIIKLALEKGYNVRGTVRSESSAAKLRGTFSAFSSQLSTAIVADITTPDAYARAFEAGGASVTGIIHTASPFPLQVENNERDLLRPATKGAVAILEAAQRHGKGKVRRVVSTSSFAAIMDVARGMRPGFTYSEADWNPMTYDEAVAVPNGRTAYCASKGRAKRGQWAWMDEHKPSWPPSARPGSSVPKSPRSPQQPT